MDETRVMYLRLQYANHFQLHVERMSPEDAREYLIYLLLTPKAFARDKRIEELMRYLQRLDS